MWASFVEGQKQCNIDTLFCCKVVYRDCIYLSGQIKYNFKITNH